MGHRLIRWMRRWVGDGSLFIQDSEAELLLCRRSIRAYSLGPGPFDRWKGDLEGVYLHGGVELQSFLPKPQANF